MELKGEDHSFVILQSLLSLSLLDVVNNKRLREREREEKIKIKKKPTKRISK